MPPCWSSPRPIRSMYGKWSRRPVHSILASTLCCARTAKRNRPCGARKISASCSSARRSWRVAWLAMSCAGWERSPAGPDARATGLANGKERVMATLNNFLAATDLSAPARHAAERAAALAGSIGASLALVHVASRAPLDQLRQLLSAADDDVEQELLDRLRLDLRGLGEVIHQRYGVAPALSVGIGDLLPSLLAEAD